MPRSEITLGFVGSGKVEKRNAYALLRDLIDASGGNARFVLPMTKTYWNDALGVVSEFAKDNGIPVEGIVDESTAKMRELKPLLAGCAKQHQSGAVAHKMALLLEGARQANLLVLWSDEDEDALDVVRAADEKGITLLELTRGLDRIELVAEDEDEEPAEEPAPDVVVEEEEPEVEPALDEEDDEEEEVEEPAAAEVDLEEDDEVEVEEEDEFPEPEAADDLGAEDDDEEEVEDEFHAEEDEEFVPPPDDEDDTVLLEDLEAPVGMTEFQRQLVALLEGATNTLATTLDMVTAQLSDQPKAVATAPRAQHVDMLNKIAQQQESAATASTPTTVKRVVKKTMPGVPAPAAPAAPKATNGAMSREQAEAVLAEYKPRRGRPPAEVAQARKLLGMA